jgi:uncharacterized glyoxalase superfamily protein PhnB
MTDTTTARSITASVEVDVDSRTAFTIFTDELELWVVQGPINFYDTTRAYGLRMESGVGGRIIEVYDIDAGEGLEIGRITDWEPGRRVAWTSSVDDVRTEVSFTGTDSGGTRVTVEATIPVGGRDEGGTAWVRFTPVWFGDWCAKRDHVAHEPLHLSRLAVAVHYEKPAAAARWLRDAFGFEPAGNLPDDEPGDRPHWIEFHIGPASLMVFGQGGAADPDVVNHEPWIFVNDLDDHFATAKAHGATIVQDIWQHGFRAYQALDLEGRRWTFAQAAPLMR